MLDQIGRGKSISSYYAWLITGMALAYAALSLFLQWRVGSVPWAQSSPIEILTDVLAFAVLGFSVAQVWRHRGETALRNGWISASVGMAILAIGESSDWFHDKIDDWYDPLPYEIGLWLLAAFLIFRCTRNYAAQRHVRYWLLAGVAVQLLANGMEIAEDSTAVLYLGQFGTVHLTIEYTELLSLLCYTSSLIFTQLGPRLATALARYLLPANAIAAATVPSAAAAVSSVEIGARARQAFHGRNLFLKPRYPTPYGLLHRQGLRQAVWLGMIALFAVSTAVRARRASGVSIRRQLRELWRLGFDQKIDAFTYYLLELYRPDRQADSGYCLTRCETKNGLLTLLNRMHRAGPGVPRDMTDKLAFAKSCAALQVATPPVLLSVENGTIESRCAVEALDADLFVKLRRGRGTKLTQRFRRIAPYRYVDRAGVAYDLADLIDWLRQRSRHGGNPDQSALIVQPHLRNHADLGDLAAQSLIAIRIVTCLNPAGEPEVTHGMLRVLAKIEPDWNPQPDTEYGAAIDVASGVLGPMTGDWPSTCTRWYARHPITGAPVLGRRLAQWPELCDLAVRAHRGFSSRVVIGWDMALTERGPVILEGNSNMDVSFIQRGYRQGIGHSRLGELLAHHLETLLRSRTEKAAARR